MDEEENKAKEELKRVDHLFYVSLKYTKTVDVIKSIIMRLINTFEFSIDDLLRDLKKKKKIKEIPNDPISKSTEILKFYNDELFIEDITLYLLLRKLNRAEYTVEREFRKHVTMHAIVDEKKFDVKVDIIQEYFRRAKNFIELSDIKIYGIPDD